MKLIDGEAVLVWPGGDAWPFSAIYHAEDDCLHTGEWTKGPISVAENSYLHIIPLRLARLAGEMAEALENIAKAAAQANHDAKLAKWFEESPNA